MNEPITPSPVFRDPIPRPPVSREETSAAPPDIPSDLVDSVAVQLVPVGEGEGEKVYRVLAIADLVRFSARQPKGTEAPYWAIVWEASIALGGWILEHRNLIQGKRMLELGCGLGLSGLVAADAGADVVQTDKIPLALRLARENALRNALAPPPQFCADWFEWSHDDAYDFVFGSDLVYEPGVIPALLPIFQRNCRPGGHVLLAAPVHREPSLTLLDDLFADGWDFETETRVIHWQQRQTEVAIWLGQRRRSQA